MEIKIKGNAHEVYRARVNTGHHSSFNLEWFNQLEAIAGKTIEVETKHLFKDQFNTAPIEGVSEIGMRIMVESVEEVIDDEREYMLKCTYCGQMSEVGTVTSEVCPHCGQGAYLEPLSNSARVSHDYILRAKAERAAGGKVEINESLPYIGLTMSDGSEYFVQGDEAEEMINEYHSYEWLACAIDDYFLAVAQNW